jgi:hypothetical protein
MAFVLSTGTSGAPTLKSYAPGASSNAPLFRRARAPFLQFSPVYRSGGCVMKRIVWINLILGIWLIIAPFALGVAAISRTPVTNDVILGILLIAFSWWMLAAIAAPLGAAWFEVLCGLWLIASPFVLQYSRIAVAMANDVIVGIITVVVALVASRTITRTPAAA